MHTYAILPLHNMVMFPAMMTTIQTNDPYIHTLINEIRRMGNEFVTSLMIREGEYFYQTGCLVHLEEIELGNQGMIQLSIRGMQKFFIESCPATEPIIYGSGKIVADYYDSKEQASSMALTLSKLVKRYVFLTQDKPESMLQAVSFINDPAILSNFCCNYFYQDAFEKQEILQTLNINKRMEQIISTMETLVKEKVNAQVTGQTHLF